MTIFVPIAYSKMLEPSLMDLSYFLTVYISSTKRSLHFYFKKLWMLTVVHFFFVVVAVIFVQFIVILDSLTAFVSNIPIYQFFPLYIFLMY